MKRFIIAKVWDVWCTILLLLSVPIVFLSFFNPIADRLIDLCIILLFSSWIAAERISGRSLEPDWSAFSYYAIYLTLVQLLLRLPNGPFGKQFVFLRTLLLACATLCILIQSYFLIRRSGSNKERNLIILWSILGIGLIIFFYIFV